MLIMNKDDFKRDGRLQVWNALAGTWPVLLPSIILVIIAGICVWALEHHRNDKEFPQEFVKGAANGVWWAIVSMTTVGYGDKSPKSFLGRLLGIVWIIFGLVICSFMVATLESAMTVTSMEKRIEIFGKKWQPRSGNQGYIEAVNQGARTKVYTSFQNAYDALVNKHEVEGILEEIPFGIANMEEVNDTRLVVSRVFEREYSYGIALDKDFPSEKHECLRDLFMYRTNDITHILENYYVTMMGEKSEAVISVFDDTSPFCQLLLYVLSILLGVLVVGGLTHQLVITTNKCRIKFIKKEEVKDKDKPTDDKNILPDVPLTCINTSSTTEKQDK